MTCLLKRHCGRRYLFAVNAAPEKVVARFDPEGIAGDIGTVDEGGRRIVAEDGGFTDAFDAFAVHIYVW